MPNAIPLSTVIEREELHYYDPENNHDKVYRVELGMTREDRGYAVNVGFGRRGGSLQWNGRCDYSLADRGRAGAVFDRAVDEKLAKGYKRRSKCSCPDCSAESIPPRRVPPPMPTPKPMTGWDQAALAAREARRTRKPAPARPNPTPTAVPTPSLYPKRKIKLED